MPRSLAGSSAAKGEHYCDRVCGLGTGSPDCLLKANLQRVPTQPQPCSSDALAPHLEVLADHKEITPAHGDGLLVDEERRANRGERVLCGSHFSDRRSPVLPRPPLCTGTSPVKKSQATLSDSRAWYVMPPEKGASIGRWLAVGRAAVCRPIRQVEGRPSPRQPEELAEHFPRLSFVAAMYALSLASTMLPAAASSAPAPRARAPSRCALGSRRALSGASLQLSAPRRTSARASRGASTRASAQLEPIDPAQFEQDWQLADRAAQKASLEFDKICMQANVSRFRARRTLDLEIKCVVAA